MPRRATSATNPADWFEFAAERLRAADVLWNSEGLTCAGVECLQEAAERYLKGYLIAKGWSLVKTHDLSRLVRDSSRFDAFFGAYQAFADELTENFFMQHYPGLDMTDIGKNYEKMRERTGEIVKHIESSVPQFFAKQP